MTTTEHEITPQAVLATQQEYIKNEREELIAHYMTNVLHVDNINKIDEDAILRHHMILRLLKIAEKSHQIVLAQLWEQFSSGGWMLFAPDSDYTFQDYVRDTMEYPDDDENTYNRTVRDMTHIVVNLFPVVSSSEIYDKDNIRISVQYLIDRVTYWKMRRAIQLFFVLDRKKELPEETKESHRATLVQTLADGVYRDLKLPSIEPEQFDTDPVTKTQQQRTTPLPGYKLRTTQNGWQIEFVTPLNDRELGLLRYALTEYTQEV